MYVLVADWDAENLKRELQAKFPELEIHAVTSEADIGPHCEKMEVLVTIFRVADDLLKRAVRLRWIQVLSAGVNYILERPSLRKEVIITSSRGIHGPQMSETALLLMLALNKDFPAVVRNQERQRWERWPGKLLLDKQVGILGMGVIGEAVADKCKAFGMTVLGIDLFPRQIASVDGWYLPEKLAEVAGRVDYLVVTAPATPETYKIVGAKVLASLKPTAYLINIARGELVDEEALLTALNAGRIAGAALDALPVEPLPADHPLWKAKNVIISPHVGGMSDIYTQQVLPIIEENLRRFLQGERRQLLNYIER
ncbi:MAG: D-2-hydroxyacid dehydrogenase [Deltaproteobacteria bacterium]|nr:D-2-hydroxyacid dehydrogenase [Deltaproteobacteria bacterium]